MIASRLSPFRHAAATRVLASLSGLVLLTGCSDTTGRQEVSGEVTLAGQPLKEGQILFRPLEKGPTAAGRIVDGAFRLDASKGPLPGPYKVSIESFETTGRKIALVDSPGTKVDEQRQIIPPKYNARSELQETVVGGGENHFTFELQLN